MPCRVRRCGCIQKSPANRLADDVVDATKIDVECDGLYPVLKAERASGRCADGHFQYDDGIERCARFRLVQSRDESCAGKGYFGARYRHERIAYQSTRQAGTLASFTPGNKILT